MMANYLLIACFLFVPFGILSLGLIHHSHHFALMVACVFIMGAYIRNRWVSAFFFMCGIWQTVLFLIVMINKLPQQELGGSMLFLFFILMAGFLYIATYTSTLKLKTFYNIICISALIQAALCVFQYFGVDPFLWVIRQFFEANMKLEPGVISGSLGNPNFVAAYLAISLPFFFRGELKARKPQWWWGAVPLAFVLIVSKSSSAVFPAIIGASYFFGGVKLMIPIMTLPLIAYAVYDNPFTQLNSSVAHGRGDIWMSAIQKIQEQPFVNLIFGRGNGAPYSRAYPMHSEWLTMLYQYGLVGVALLSGYVVTISRKNKVLFTAFIIAAINMLGNYPLHLAPSAFLIVMIAGLIERERGDDGKRER